MHEHLNRNGNLIYFTLNLSKLNPKAFLLKVIGMRGDTFISLWRYIYLLVLFGSDFVSLIDINRVNLTHWTYSISQKMPVGGAKDERFSCFHSSCQWGLRSKQFYSRKHHLIIKFFSKKLQAWKSQLCHMQCTCNIFFWRSINCK